MTLKEKRSALLDEIAELSLNSMNIKAQIEEYKGTKKEMRERDEEWLRSAQYALRATSRDWQIANRELGEINREIKKTHALPSHERKFIQMAKLMLPPELYQAIWTRTNAEAECEKSS